MLTCTYSGGVIEAVSAIWVMSDGVEVYIILSSNCLTIETCPMMQAQCSGVQK